jgi:serine/threonine-protein kinase RsbW
LPGHTLSLELTDPLAELGSVRQALSEFGRQHGLSAEVVFGVAVAIDEIVTNVASYDTSGQDTRRITLRLALDGGDLRIEVCDDGRPFNPLDVPSPDTGAALEDRPVGGLGIHLVRSLMDDVAYRRQDGRNILAMRKRAAE